MSDDKYRLDVVLENCEVISFSVGDHHKSSAHLEDITKNIHIGFVLGPSIDYFIKSTYLILYKNDLLKEKSEIFELDPWDRIKTCNDVTQIYLYKNDSLIQWGFVKWEDKSEYSNPYQTNELSQNGSIVITIEENK